MNLFNYLKPKETFDDLVSEDEKCKELIARIETAYQLNLRPLTLRNLSNYFLIDMLERVFNKGNITGLPAKINVLDVGVGEWYYAPALLSFLKFWNGPREVCLEGVDFPKKRHSKSVKKLCKDWNLKIHWSDIMDFEEGDQYDIIFMMHMLSGPSHCRKFEVPYRRPSLMFPKIQSLGKPDSLFVLTAYNWAGEDSIINCFRNTLAEMLYKPSVGENFSSVIGGYLGFHDNWVCVFKAPYVDLQSCKEREESIDWDNLRSTFKF